MAQTVETLPAMQETWVQSLGWEDPLEKGIAIPTPVILPGEFHGQRSLVGYSTWDRKELDMAKQLSLSSGWLLPNFDSKWTSIAKLI